MIIALESMRSSLEGIPNLLATFESWCRVPKLVSLTAQLSVCHGVITFPFRFLFFQGLITTESNCGGERRREIKKGNSIKLLKCPLVILFRIYGAKVYFQAILILFFHLLRGITSLPLGSKSVLPLRKIEGLPPACWYQLHPWAPHNFSPSSPVTPHPSACAMCAWLGDSHPTQTSSKGCSSGTARCPLSQHLGAVRPDCIWSLLYAASNTLLNKRNTVLIQEL